MAFRHKSKKIKPTVHIPQNLDNKKDLRKTYTKLLRRIKTRSPKEIERLSVMGEVQGGEVRKEADKNL